MRHAQHTAFLGFGISLFRFVSAKCQQNASKMSTLLQHCALCCMSVFYLLAKVRSISMTQLTSGLNETFGSCNVMLSCVALTLDSLC